MPPSQFLINHVDYFLGEKLIATEYGIGNYLTECIFDCYDDIYNVSVPYNIDPTTYNGLSTTIVQNATHTYTIDITGILSQLKLYMH